MAFVAWIAALMVVAGFFFQLAKKTTSAYVCYAIAIVTGVAAVFGLGWR